MALGVKSEYLTPLPRARSNSVNFNLPLPVGLDQTKIGVDLDDLKKTLQFASIAFLTVDGKYDSNKGNDSSLYSSEHRVIKPLDEEFLHFGIWATAHLGLNLPAIEKKIVPKQKDAQTAEQAWADSLDKVVREAIFKLGIYELQSKNLSRGDSLTIGLAAVNTAGYFLKHLNEVGDLNPLLVPVVAAGIYCITNTIITVGSHILLTNASMVPNDGYRKTLFTPEFDNMLMLTVATKLFKHIDFIGN